MNKILIADDDPVFRLFLSEVMKKAGYAVSVASEGMAALKKLKQEEFDVVLLDIWMPKMNGIEILSILKTVPSPPKVVIMTNDDTPEAVLQAVRERAYRFVKKPIDPAALVEIVRKAIAAGPGTLPIEVLSARPTWVELLLPCEIEAVERVEDFLMNLKSDLAKETRRSIAAAFHELLLNAVEWGGKLDPNRKVRISYVRTKRMVLYRIADPGPGFRFQDLEHAAISNPTDDPMAHSRERERQGLRPGGLGLMLTQHIVDELVYNEAQNEVLFVKYSEKQKGGDA